MPDSSVQVEIPHRSLFKAAEVCDLVKVQPYVLRSWEAEFPALGVSKSAGGPRVYRRTDVEQVVRIKHLLLVEGLTLAGARRRIDEESGPVMVDEPAMGELASRNARERLTAVKRGLRSILELIGRNGREGQGGHEERERLDGQDRLDLRRRETAEFRLSPPVAAPRSRESRASRAKVSRRKTAASRHGSARASRPRR